MKRCPQCNRVETDNALAFCRVDGTPLISDSARFDQDAGTIKLDSDPLVAENATKLLESTHPATNEIENRFTAPTTMLVSPQTSASQVAPPNTQPKPKRRWPVVVGVPLLFVFALLALVGFYMSRKPAKAINSIAVMPFINASNNDDVEYISDGMTETLINSLSQLPDLSVKARTSVFRYKGKEVEPQTVGNELNVQAILNGRVVQRGNDLTLYLSLVDTRTGNQLWGEQYNRRPGDLLSLQNEVGRDVATKLKTKLSGVDEQRVAKSYTQNAEAYQLYLQGRFFANKRTPESIQKAIDCYQNAIEKDPNYALGYAGLSDGYGLLAYYGGAPAPQAMSKARAAAAHALSLDNTLAESHNALGFVLAIADYNYPGAETEYKRALQINPNYTPALHNLGVMLARTGRAEEGLADLRHALEIEPFSIIVNRLYGECLVYLRRYDEGLAQLQKTSEMDSAFPTTYFALSNAYRLQGKHAESVEAYAKFNELFNRPETAALVRTSFATGGWKGFLEEMTSKRPPGVSQYMAAIFFAELGEKDKAFQEIDAAFQNLDYQLRFIKIDPSVDALRDDPRFKDLLRKMNFEE